MRSDLARRGAAKHLDLPRASVFGDPNGPRHVHQQAAMPSDIGGGSARGPEKDIPLKGG